jgi:hypothetical protein
MLPRSVELGTTEPPFPIITQTPTTAGITPNTSTTHLNTGAAHMSTSTLLGVPQTSLSTHTNHTPLSGLGKHRAIIQTTVDKLRDLVERNRTLTVEPTNIPPITQAQINGLLGRGVPLASEPTTQTPQKDQQDEGGVG